MCLSADQIKKNAQYEMALIQNVGLLKENEYLRRFLKKLGDTATDQDIKWFVEREWTRDYKGTFTRTCEKEGKDPQKTAQKAWDDFLKTIPDHTYLQNLKPHAGKDGILRFLLIAGGGGVGDALMYTSMIQALKQKFWPCEFTFFFTPTIADDLCQGTQLIDSVLTGDWGARMAGLSALEELDLFDMVIFSPCFFPRFVVCRDSRLMNNEASRQWITGNNSIADLLARFSTNFGTNLIDRVLQTSYLNLLGRITGLPISDATPLLFSPDPQALKTIQARAIPTPYVTVRDGANGGDMKAAHELGETRTNKQIASETWKSLVRKLKDQGITTVQVGAGPDPQIEGVNFDLRSKTTLSELCFLMKNAITHIDTEGGLVHFARACHKETIALYGSTSETFFGYPQNENISTEACTPCFYSDFTWIARCPRGTKGPACATNFNEEKILQAVDHFKNEQEKTRFSIISVITNASTEEKKKLIKKTLAEEQLPPTPHIAYIGNAPELREMEESLGKNHLIHAVFTGDKPDQRQNPSPDDLAPWLEKPATQATYGSIWNLPINSYAFACVLCPSALTSTQSPELPLQELLRLIPEKGIAIIGLTSTAESLDTKKLLSVQDLQTKTKPSPSDLIVLKRMAL